MQRRSNIRWSASDEAELKRVVKNFNAKVTRLAKKDPSNAAALPEKVSAANLRDMIETRQDLKRELNSLQRFSRKGAEEIIIAPETNNNLKVTKWQKEEINRRLGTINRTRSQRLKKLMETEATQGGKGLGYSAAPTMGKAAEVSLKPLPGFTKEMNRADLRARWKQLVKESQSGYWNWRDEVLKENYIKGLYENFNPDDIADIVEQIRGMDIKDFRNSFDSDQGKFETLYPNDNDEYIAALDQLRSIWMPENGDGL